VAGPLQAFGTHNSNNIKQNYQIGAVEKLKKISGVEKM